MSALSIFSAEGGPAFGCANPIYPTCDLSFRPGDKFVFEVLERDASQLKSLLGKAEMFGFAGGAFFARLVSLQPCPSTVSALAMMREVPTLRGVFEIYPTPPLNTNN